MTRTLNSLLVLAAWAFVINLAAAGMCENVQKCLPTKFVTDKGTLTCEIKGTEFHCTTVPGTDNRPTAGGGGGSGGSGGPDETLAEIGRTLDNHSPTPFNEICPKFNGKEFTTKRPSNGEIAKWKVHCDTRASGGDSREEGCHGGSITQILTQRQGNRDFRGFTWRHNNRCTDITPHSRHGWTSLVTRPAAHWAYIERIDIDFS